MVKVCVLIPTYKRVAGLAVTLTGLYYQTYKNFEVIISDQNDDDRLRQASVETAVRMLRSRDIGVQILKHLPRRGMAEQRQFLLEQSEAKYCLFLDDDLVVERWVLKACVKALREEGCGFVGRPVVGLSFVGDRRPEEERIELWTGKVRPEEVLPDSQQWQRYRLHNAANMWHVEKKLGLSWRKQLKYKVAWIGGCVMYDRNKLLQAGGFSFWKELPINHAGEDVLAQLRVMKRFGGCGLLPSGVYHQELPTTIDRREADAPRRLPI